MKPCVGTLFVQQGDPWLFCLYKFVSFFSFFHFFIHHFLLQPLNMKLSVFIVTIFAFFATQVFGYLSERSAPFTVTLEDMDSTTLQVKRGDTIHISW